MKMYKRKRRSCAVCKPHKMGLAKKFKPKELATRLRMQREAR